MGRAGRLPSLTHVITAVAVTADREDLGMDGDDTAGTAPARTAGPGTARRRLRRFRVPVLIVALMAVLLGTHGLNVLAEPVPVVALIVGFATAAAALAGYFWLSRTVELRSDVPELTRVNRWPGLALFLRSAARNGQLRRRPWAVTSPVDAR